MRVGEPIPPLAKAHEDDAERIARLHIASWRATYNLHVAPWRHGQRLGSRLFDSAVALARERDARELMLWVVRTNARARAFYERKGMRWDGGEQDHALSASDVLHEVRYRMRLCA